ncbi:MAG: molybdopterin-dependent oxidoreductase [Thermodesulfobacteriota bacterium]|nr:molybdopterin-dependent oxidoreductase [Thermodesulfobacteriota bacterium]
MPESRRSYCGLCHLRCGLILEVEKGRAVKVLGDPDHPISLGKICSRGHLMIDHVYHENRLNFPLKRKGERGAGRWERIGWEQALNEVADKLGQLRDAYGAETLAFTHGTKRTYHWDERRFNNLFGTPNICGANNVCMCPSQAIEFATYGGFAQGDIRQTRCLVVWGHAPSQSYPNLIYPEIVTAKKNGAKLIVVDPRRTKEAKMADIWLGVKPGTDTALMMGWLRVIMEENLYDHDFVEKWTVGFDDLKKSVADYTPERVAETTWLTPEQVMNSARMYAMTRPAAITWGFGIDKQGINAAQAARARGLLRAITGNLDVPGGELLGWNDPVGKIIDDAEMEFNEALPAVQRAKQLGANEYPFFGFPGWERNVEANRRLPSAHMHPPHAGMTCVAHARPVFQAMLTGEPYPVKAAISVASNPLLALPNVRRTYEALNSLDLYVVGEFYMTPSAALADYVFPICSTVETSELWLTPGFCVAGPRGIDPLRERRNTYDFWRGLGVRLGQEDYWPWRTVDDVWDHMLSPVGLTFDKLLEQNGLFGRPEYRRYERFGFGTPSGKVELRSGIFEALGCEPLPVYRELPHSALSSPDLAKRFPLVLITGSRFMPMYHSEHRQIESARKKRPDPLVTIHPETAAELGLEPGDWVLVETPTGSIRMRLSCSDAIDVRMADADHGWWFPERREAGPDPFGVFESNANILCPDGAEFCSPETGSWPHTALLCKVEKEEIVEKGG